MARARAGFSQWDTLPSPTAALLMDSTESHRPPLDRLRPNSIHIDRLLSVRGHPWDAAISISISSPTRRARRSSPSPARRRAIRGHIGDRARLSPRALDTQLERVIAEIETAPGIVLYTLVDQDLAGRLEEAAATRARRISRCSRRCTRCSSPISAPIRRPGPAPAHAERGVFQAHRRDELHAPAR